MRTTVTAALAMSLGSVAYAQSIAKTCPKSDICYKLNIPESTASSGKGDIFFQVSASTSYQWVAIGQGSSMSGSNIFVVYTSANGNNVTVSPRLGTGHNEPQHDTSSQIEVLAGSGVSNGMMTANVKCSNCESWSGGSMDFTGSSSNWIYAYKSGDSLATDDLSASISQHNEASPFTWSLASAKGGDSVNPFVSNAVTTGTASGSGSAAATSSCIYRPASATAGSQTLASPTGSGCPTAWPSQFSTSWPTARPTWAASCSISGQASWPTSAPWSHNNKRESSDPPYCDDSGSSSSSSSSDTGDNDSASFENKGAPFGGDYEMGNRIISAHGALASLAFVGLFPIGGILIRIASFTGLIWVHAAMQVVAYLIYIIAFGMGAYLMSQLRNSLSSHAHPIIGGILFLILLSQPISGLLHHKLFKKYGRRTGWSYAHLTVGRVAILFGMLNGGLGLALAGAGTGAKIAYAIVAAIMAVAYIVSIVLGERRRRNNLTVPPSYGQATRLKDDPRDAPIGLTERFGKTRR